MWRVKRANDFDKFDIGHIRYYNQRLAFGHVSQSMHLPDIKVVDHGDTDDFGLEDVSTVKRRVDTSKVYLTQKKINC